VLTAEKIRGGSRLEFVCGGRALRTLRTLHDAVSRCIRHLSVAPEDLPAAIERLQADGKDQRKIVKGLQERLAVFEAAALAEAAEQVGEIRQVVRAVDGQDQAGLKAMAATICAAPGFRAALFSTSSPHVAVLAKSKDAPGDCAAALKTLLAAFGGRGGGKPDLAQGGGLDGDLAQIVDAAKAALSRT
jgi:alanyl-tRNA synthetase